MNLLLVGQGRVFGYDSGGESWDGEGAWDISVELKDVSEQWHWRRDVLFTCNFEQWQRIWLLHPEHLAEIGVACGNSMGMDESRSKAPKAAVKERSFGSHRKTAELRCDDQENVHMQSTCIV